MSNNAGMFDVTDKELVKLQEYLRDVNKKAIPTAVRFTLSRTAQLVKMEAQDNVGRKMTERNKWTRNSFKSVQARGMDIDRMESVAGSINPYMEKQEFGGVKRKRGKVGVSIPTNYSAKQGRGLKPRTRRVVKANKLENIILKGKRVSKKYSRKQAFLAKVNDAINTGNRMFYHESKKKKGIYKVTGGSKKIKRGWNTGAVVQTVYDLSEKSVKIDKTPTLLPAVQYYQPRISSVFAGALRYQEKFVRKGLK